MCTNEVITKKIWKNILRSEWSLSKHYPDQFHPTRLRLGHWLASYHCAVYIEIHESINLVNGHKLDIIGIPCGGQRASLTSHSSTNHRSAALGACHVHHQCTLYVHFTPCIRPPVMEEMHAEHVTYITSSHWWASKTLWYYSKQPSLDVITVTWSAARNTGCNGSAFIVTW